MAIAFQNKCNKFHPTDFKGLRKPSTISEVMQILQTLGKNILMLK